MRVLWLALATIAAGCGSGPAAPPASAADMSARPAPEVVAEAVRGAVEQYRQAYQVRSLEALEALYARDLDVSLVVQGQHHRGFTAVSTYLTQLLSQVSEVRVVISDLAVAAAGTDAAVATARFERHLGDGEATVSERGVLTLVFRQIDGTWLIVSEHFSYPSSLP